MEKTIKVLVLGGGLIGKPLAVDLAGDKELRITVADKNINVFNGLHTFSIDTVQADLSDERIINKLVKPFDIVVNAVPGFMGFNTLKAVINAGKDCIDFAFFPENVLLLKPLAMEKGVRVISDLGVAPGMSNLLSGDAAREMDEIDTLEILVGGLPKIRQQPWEYKAVFSPVDVIEEYTRPARMVVNGKIVTVPPLTDVEQVYFEEAGALEAFNSDGLRSLLFTMKARNMCEKTLRYPGYASKIKLLSDSGFFDTEPVLSGQKTFIPLEVTSAMLFNQWKLEEEEHDFTVMRITAKGNKNDKPMTITYNLYDEYDEKTKTHSMARTTAYTASMGVRLLLSGLLNDNGLYLPEELGDNEKIVSFFLNGLADRKVFYKKSVR